MSRRGGGSSVERGILPLIPEPQVEGKANNKGEPTAPEGTKGACVLGGSPKKEKRSFPLCPSLKSPSSEGGGKRKGGKVQQRESRMKKGKNSEQNTNGAIHTQRLHPLGVHMGEGKITKMATF